MKNILSIKKVMFILICIIIMFSLDSYKTYDEEKELKETSNLKIKNQNILYKRIGEEKGIYSYDVLSRKNKMLYNLSTEYFYADNDIGIFFRERENSKGIYICENINSENNNTKNYTKETMVLKDYLPISNGKKFNKEIVFLAEGMNKSEEKLICRYNLDTKEFKTYNIEAFKNSYVKDVEFVEDNTFVYSKKTNNIKSSTYQIYYYDLIQNKEFQIENFNSETINPVLSHDKNKIAYIKKDTQIYSLYVKDFKSGKTSKILLKEGVVRGSIKWSLNDEYILCITANNGYRDILNIINLETNVIEKVDNIYSGIFSKDNKSIIGASYDKDKSLQKIYAIDIETKEKNILYSFFEGGSFSRSLSIENTGDL